MQVFLAWLFRVHDGRLSRGTDYAIRVDWPLQAKRGREDVSERVLLAPYPFTSSATQPHLNWGGERHGTAAVDPGERLAPVTAAPQSRLASVS